ncbi:MAG: hypothetical protein ACOCZU_06170 [Planctomycetota bacterium]
MSDERPTPYRWVVRLAVLAGVCYLAWMLMVWFGRNLTETDRTTEARKHTWLVLVDANTARSDATEIDVRRPRGESLANVAAALEPLWDANEPGRVRVVLKAWQQDPNAIRHSAWGEGVKMLDALCAPPAWSIQPAGGQLRVSVPADPNVPAVGYPADVSGRSALAARVYDTVLESHRALAPNFARNAPQVPNPKNREMDRIPEPLSP